MDWLVFFGVLVWVTSALVLCCLRVADEADEQIERMNKQDTGHEPL